MINTLQRSASDIAARLGVSINKAASAVDTTEALGMLQPSGKLPSKMIRLGGNSDGSYTIPDDLEGITACFSPGIGPSSSFEYALAERGIQVLMADASVKGPAANHAKFRFRPAYLASFTDSSRQLISMEEWVQSECGNEPCGDLILQMDIEGDEYEVIHSMSEALLRRFRIIVIEFHHLNQLRHGVMCRYMRSAFTKLLKHFNICHVQENWAAGGFSLARKRYSRLQEVSFLRKDNRQ